MLSIIVLVLVFAVLVGIGIWKKKNDLYLNFAMRILVGVVAIYLCNSILNTFHITMAVGINGASSLVIGSLGTPGFLLLYGVSLYYMLK